MFIAMCIVLGAISWLIMGGINIAILTAKDGSTSEEEEFWAFSAAPFFLLFFVVYALCRYPFMWTIEGGKTAGHAIRDRRRNKKAKKQAKDKGDY